MLPTFFFSYSRRDADTGPSPLLRQFFDDLQDRLEQRTSDVPPGARLGIIDRGLALGADWDDKLSSGLRTSKVLVAIATPTYFSRESCGKEIAVFARRHPDARIDTEGSLRHTTNILHIRWFEASAYERNGVPEGALHPILKKINWHPSEDESDAAVRAVKRYREKGLEMCVRPRRDYYEHLLRMFVDTIKRTPDLPSAEFDVKWNSITSAFESDWSDVPQDAEQRDFDGPPERRAEIAEPSGPSDLAVFYITDRGLNNSGRAVSFADTLIDGLDQGSHAPYSQIDSISQTAQAMEQAAAFEQLRVFHCASDPPVPDTPDLLVRRLAELTKRNVLITLVVDASIWSVAGGHPRQWVIEKIAQSSNWRGAIIVPLPYRRDHMQRAMAVATSLQGVRLVSVLRDSGGNWIQQIRSILVQERGRILESAARGGSSDASSPPLLQGPGSQISTGL